METELRHWPVAFCAARAIEGDRLNVPRSGYVIQPRVAALRDYPGRKQHRKQATPTGVAPVPFPERMPQPRWGWNVFDNVGSQGSC
jgi:hypothetical protein